jgi:hypothetical protein
MRRVSYFVLVTLLYCLLDGELISAGVSGWPYWAVHLICIAISVVSMADMAAWKGN